MSPDGHEQAALEDPVNTLLPQKMCRSQVQAFLFSEP